MVQDIEGFRSELQLVSFLDTEVFMHLGIDGKNSRSEGSVAPNVTELPQGCFDESGTVVPSVGAGIGEAGSHAG